MNYANKIKDSLYWWLGKKRPFIINNEYKLELLFVDINNMSAKIRITNLKTGEIQTTPSEDSYGQE
jgi:hypothetical protein